jgi:hypothetical protein
MWAASAVIARHASMEKSRSSLQSRYKCLQFPPDFLPTCKQRLGRATPGLLGSSRVPDNHHQKSGWRPFLSRMAATCTNISFPDGGTCLLAWPQCEGRSWHTIHICHVGQPVQAPSQLPTTTKPMEWWRQCIGRLKMPYVHFQQSQCSIAFAWCSWAYAQRPKKTLMSLQLRWFLVCQSSSLESFSPLRNQHIPK